MNENEIAKKDLTIVTGGQTGADRAAFDFALANEIPIAGWVPRGRVAEDGIIPQRYVNLRETESKDPAERTKLNVEISDGLLVLKGEADSPGTTIAIEWARRISKPVLEFDLESPEDVDEIGRTLAWLNEHQIRTVNIAGPRHSEDPGIYKLTRSFLKRLLS